MYVTTCFFDMLVGWCVHVAVVVVDIYVDEWNKSL